MSKSATSPFIKKKKKRSKSHEAVLSLMEQSSMYNASKRSIISSIPNHSLTRNYNHNHSQHRHQRNYSLQNLNSHHNHNYGCSPLPPLPKLDTNIEETPLFVMNAKMEMPEHEEVDMKFDHDIDDFVSMRCHDHDEMECNQEKIDLLEQNRKLLQKIECLQNKLRMFECQGKNIHRV